jgi:membrane-associated phospholipid phosphatase
MIKYLTLSAMVFLGCSFNAAEPARADGSVETLGHLIQYGLPLVALGAGFAEEGGNKGAVEFAKVFALSSVATIALKEATHKRRPNGSCCESFPSGHTSAAFAAARFIDKRYGREYGVPAYMMATIVGYSRVHADKHFTEDVIAGAVVGIVSANIFTTPYKGVEIVPVVDAGGNVGIGYQVKF